METLKLSDGRVVNKEDYITAKTKDLREFGYYDVKESEVSNQLEKIQKGEKLSVIGIFMEDEIDSSEIQG